MPQTSHTAFDFDMIGVPLTAKQRMPTRCGDHNKAGISDRELNASTEPWQHDTSHAFCCSVQASIFMKKETRTEITQPPTKPKGHFLGFDITIPAKG